MSKALEKSIKISGVNLPFSKEFEKLSKSCKTAYSAKWAAWNRISYFLDRIYKLLYTILTNNFEKHGNTEIGLQFASNDLSPFLK